LQDYKKLLDRAIEQLPPGVLEIKRFTTPKVYSVIQGNRTLIQNFKEIAAKLNRDPQHLLRYLLRELGTAGNIEDKRAILQGKFTHFVINDRIEDYVKKFVLCPECNRPDTRIIKESRISLLKCEACGAKAPLKPV